MASRLYAERFDLLFDRDLRSRWRILIISSLCTAIVGFTSEATGASLHDAQVFAAVVGSFIYALQVWLYVTRPLPGLSGVIRFKGRVYLLRSAIALASAAFLALAASTSALPAQAALLNWRLRNAIERNKIAATGKVFDDALGLPVVLQGNLVAKATDRLQHQSGSEAWEAYVALVNYTVNHRQTEDPLALRDNVARLQGMLETTTPVCGPRNTGISAFSFTNKNHVTTKIESLERWPQTIFSCQESLDGKEIKDTLFNFVVLRYLGGPVNLQNVRLASVLFDLPEDAPNVRRLAQAALEAKDDIITIRID